jgi:hypothetical protein
MWPGREADISSAFSAKIRKHGVEPPFTQALCLGLTRPGREADISSSFSAKIRKHGVKHPFTQALCLGVMWPGREAYIHLHLVPR